MEQRFRIEHRWPANLLWETVLGAFFTDGTNQGKG